MPVTTTPTQQQAGTPPVPPPAPPAPVTEDTASQEAVSTGKPVEVTADTTDTKQVLATPDGGFSLSSNVRPVRVQKAGAWVPIDTTLKANPDGTWGPAATTENVTFSGGGTTPLITLVQDGKKVTFTWPTALPKPTVSASTVTYPAVLPGVDLQVSADAESYSEVLIVHDATAAANPALAHLHMTVTGTGLTVTADSNGALMATDTAGAIVFHGTTPLMWDSTYDPNVGTAPTATDHGTGAVNSVPATTTPLTPSPGATSIVDVSMTPSSAALTGPGVKYPVYIDPSMSRGEEVWDEVTANGWHYFNQDQIAQVGDCGSWAGCSGLTVARSFFQMGTEDISGHPNGRSATVFAAKFYANEVWSAHNCTAEPVDVAVAGLIITDTRWPGPGGGPTANEQSSAAGSNCGGANNVIFDLTSQAQTAANGGWTNMTLELRSPNEGNQYQWKQFSNNPTLVIDYSYPPNAATDLSVSNVVSCTGHNYTPDARPTLSATATDNNNPPLNPQLWFHLANGTGTTALADSTTPVTIASGTRGGWQAPPTLAGGDYEFRTTVSTNNGNGSTSSHEIWNGSYSPWYSFTHLTAPTQTPVAQSADYPANYWGQPSNNGGQILFSTNGAPNIAGFSWTATGAGTEPAPITTECNYNQTFGTTGGYVAPDPANGWASLAAPSGWSVGYHTIYVRSFDLAHNMSPESQPYVFYVAPPTAATSGWSEAENLPFSQPAGQNVGLAKQPNCCNVSWSGGAQLVFVNTAPAKSFSETITAPVAGNYDLGVMMTKAPDYGQVEFTLDGQSVGPASTNPVDGYNRTVTTSYQPLGGASLAAGSHTLTVTVVGTNTASTGNRYMAGLDAIYVRPTNQLDAESPQQVRAADLSTGNITPVAEPIDSGTSWRGGGQLLYPATAVGQSVSLTFSAQVEADYALGAALTHKANYGQLTFKVDADTVLAHTDATPVDTYNSTEQVIYQTLGGVHLTAGPHTVTITIAGKNSSSAGYQAGVDYLTAAAINNITAASFTAAMNNHGIAVDGTTGANFDLWGNNGLSTKALSTAGLAPGSAVTVSGATFTMPAASSNGNDNVIADGQTIPLPSNQQVKANAIGLLVASTCGSSPAATATVTYTDGTTSRAAVPSVPDWVYGSSTTATSVLSYIDNPAATPFTNRASKFYTAFLPTDPTRTLQKITLPYTGTGLLTNTCNTGAPVTSALHVLTMAPRPVTSGTLPAGAAGWLGSWAAPTDAATTPPGGKGLADQTIRMVIHPAATGSSARVRLSNTGAGAASPSQPAPSTATIDAATIGAESGTTGTGAATLATPSTLTFGGSHTVTIPAGGEVTSDPVTFPSTTGGSGNLTISVHLPTAITRAPMHTDANSTTYLANGNTTTDTTGTPYTTPLTSDYYLTGLDVTTTDASAGTVAVLGDQTSAVGASGAGRTDQQTWVDDLPGVLGSSLPGSVVNVSRAGAPSDSWWKLNDTSGTTAADSNGTHPGTATSGVTWNGAWAGDTPGSATLNGTTGAITTGQALNTTQSFTISAWANLSATGASQTVVAQDAGQNSGFDLQYDGPDNRWSFTRSTSDAHGSTVVRSLSGAAPQTGAWTHLAGVFDAEDGNMTLYVNGQGQASAGDDSPYAANGPLTIGRDQVNGASAGFFNGGVSDVRAYQRILDQYGVAQLYDAPSPEQLRPEPGAPSAYALGNVYNNGPAIPASPNTELNRTLLNEPNIRTVIVPLGTNDVLNNGGITTVEANLTAILRSTTNGYALQNSQRSDGAALHLILTTIPPLGLGTTDPREVLRVNLNNQIRSNYTQLGADEYIDFDQAVRDSANPNQINPADLTGGQPNATYYHQLAQSVADAVNNFPPTATL
jgi:hypothetical protein